MHVEPTLPSRPSDRHGRRAAAAAGVAAATAVAVVLATTPRAALRRVHVVGESMAPAFQPGDRLLVVRAPRRVRLRAGDVVAASDPRTAGRLLVKRVVSSTDAGAVVLAGDNAARSTDSRQFGAVERGSVWGIVRYRYAPAGRSGVVGRGRPDRRARAES